MAPGKKLTWSPRKMRLAVEEVKSGAKLRKTAFKFGIPVMSLHDHVKKGSEFKARLGGKPVFNMEQEAEIRDQLIKLSNTFYGLTPIALRRAVYRYAEKNKIKHPFNTQKEEAGKDWFYGFLKRNPEVSVRMPEATSVNRISAFNQHEMEIFFKNLLNIFEKHSIPPNRIYNVDETGVTTVHKPSKIIAPKGQKQVGAATSWERGKNVTVCCCMSAIGHFIPPMFIFPRIRMTPALERGGPPGSVYTCSKSGWMMEDLFLDWLKHFVAHTRPSVEDVVLLILDNHGSHISLAIYDYCRENGVLMLSLPPHTSHRTQPLDLTFFGPLKLQYHRECDLFMKMNSLEKITPYDIALLFSKAYLKTANAEKAVNGFAAAGIWPVEPDKFAYMYVTTDDAMEPMPSTNVTTQMPTRDFEELNPLSPSTSAIIPSVKPTRNAPNSPILSTSGILPPSMPTQSVAQSDTPDQDEVESYVPFADCSPAPPPRKKASDEGGKGKDKGRKQHSQILTSTPIKVALEIKNTLKTMKQEKAQEKDRYKGKKVLKDKENFKKKNSKPSKKKREVKSSYQRRILNSSSSEDEKLLLTQESNDSDNVFCEAGETGVTNELCVICGEFGKDQELWYRCIVCGNWVHALCSDRDKPDGYICGFCNVK